MPVKALQEFVVPLQQIQNPGPSVVQGRNLPSSQSCPVGIYVRTHMLDHFGAVLDDILHGRPLHVTPGIEALPVVPASRLQLRARGHRLLV